MYGGVIALIENGDEIEMDIAGGTVNLLVSDEILAERRKSGYVRRLSSRRVF